MNNLQFTGDDFFADKDVCSIGLEVPNFALGGKAVGLWHQTLVRADGTEGGWIQAERGARPLQLFLVLGLSGAERDACLSGEPSNDIGFVAAFGLPLEHTGEVYPAGSKAGGRDDAAGESSLMIPRAQRPSRRMAGLSPTTLRIPSFLFSQMVR